MLCRRIAPCLRHIVCTRALGGLPKQKTEHLSSDSPKHRLTSLRHLVNTYNIAEELIGDLRSSNCDLSAASAHLFSGGGKYFRPTCVMLMGEACNHGNPSNPAQREIALITELIHVASLVHDDVLDSADTRRSLATVNSLYNDKVAILSGDYIIAVATSKLARLGCSYTISILSSVIRDLIKGEIQQLNRETEHEALFEKYLEKTYLKTASLIAHGCQAVAFNSCRPSLQHSAYRYGRHLGISFQIVDDLLDVVSCSEELGKAAGSDLQLGLATAPVLYASIQQPCLMDLIQRGFSNDGDVEEALRLINESDAIQQSRDLASHHAELALAELTHLPSSPYREGLETLCEIVLHRSS